MKIIILTIVILIIFFIYSEEKVIIKAPYIDQTKRWPTGCESVSTVMALQYLGIKISVDEFIKYLDKSEIVSKKGQLFASDPKESFIGSPYSQYSFGCFAPVIVKALKKILPKYEGNKVKYEIKDLTGVSMQTLKSNYLDKKIPVIFWATMNMAPKREGRTWIIKETGKKFTWPAGEHCLLLVGYDNDKYYFNDPWQNHGLIGYEKTLVETRHKELYSMALAVYKKKHTLV